MLDSKISGITRFLYQFCKILPKYCGRKENDHNILWSKWYSRRESNPQRPLRRGLLYPFNYGSILNFITRGRNDCQKKFYTKIYTNFFPPRENKHKSSGFARKTCVLGNILWIEQYLGGGRYIHLTKEAYISLIVCCGNTRCRSWRSRLQRSAERTHNCPLGGGRYIYLTKEADTWILYCFMSPEKRSH